jgi:hypothetical protein
MQIRVQILWLLPFGKLVVTPWKILAAPAVNISNLTLGQNYKL